MYIKIEQHNEDMARKDAEIAAKDAKIAMLKSVLCDTCGGAGFVMIAIDDGIDCPTCLETANKIKAEGIREALSQWGLCSDKNLRVNLEFYANDLASDREGE